MNQILVKRDRRVTKKTISKIRSLPEQMKQSHNLSILLRFSNITPFRDRNALGYICAYCYKTYPDPNDLRSHTKTAHQKHRLAYSTAHSIKGLNRFLPLLDIVDLKCTICDHSVEDIKALIDHLTKHHGKTYYTDITDYMQPFKLTLDQKVQCCLCSENFESIRNLIIHMNVHFRNFICLICGKGFINKYRLISHESTHEQKKPYPCKLCDQMFDCEWKRKGHIIQDHKGLTGQNVCQICNERFKNYYQKSKHMIDVHGHKAVQCELCDRKFPMKSQLLQHTRRDHLKERSYTCQVCKMSFFVKTRMLEHMVVHTGQKEFSCDICGKAFSRKKNLRVHFKTHDSGSDGRNM